MRSVYIGLCFLICLALSMSLAYAQQMGIGVEPTIVDIYLSKDNDRTYLPIRVWNPSNQDMVFKLSIEENLRDYVQYDCLGYYWCEKDEYYVPAYTEKHEATEVSVLFVKKTDEEAEFESAIYVQGRPTEQPEGMIILTPRIMIRTTIHQTATPTTTTTVYTGSAESSSSIEIPDATTTTTMPDVLLDGETIISPATTTTTIESEEIVPQQSGMNPFFIVGVIVIVVVSAVVIYVWKEGLLFILPFLMFIMMSGMGYAYNVPMNVTVIETPAPIQPYQLATGIFPVIIIAGLFLWFLRGLEEITFERLVGSLLTVIIAIALVGILAGLI